MAILDLGARTPPHGDPLCPVGAHHAAETLGGTCPDCRHYRSDCVCWYVAEVAAGQREMGT
jgi:hypothetical protein